MGNLNKTSTFDFDLKYGQIREKRVAELLKDGKVEVKTERSWWRKTGNVAIEYEYRGKPSGIDKTEAKWWFHILELKNKEYFITGSARGSVNVSISDINDMSLFVANCAISKNLKG